MSYTRNTKYYVVFSLILAVLSWIMMAGVLQAAEPRSASRDKDRAVASGHQGDRSRPAEGPHVGNVPGIHKGAEVPPGIRRPHVGNVPGIHRGAEVPRIKGSGPNRREFMDSRYHHDRSYPARGRYIHTLPHDRHEVFHGGSRYYFRGGVWYRPYGARFVVVAPPFGLVIPFLPPYYTTIWVGGFPYYYANDVYYAQTEGGYKVVEPPQGEATQESPTAGQLYIYPRNGQSEQQQANDRYECHRWAVGQTGYDPTQPAGNTPEAQINQKRTDYQRAMGACLEGRGYTVK